MGTADGVGKQDTNLILGRDSDGIEFSSGDVAVYAEGEPGVDVDEVSSLMSSVITFKLLNFPHRNLLNPASKFASQLLMTISPNLRRLLGQTPGPVPLAYASAVAAT